MANVKKLAKTAAVVAAGVGGVALLRNPNAAKNLVQGLKNFKPGNVTGVLDKASKAIPKAQGALVQRGLAQSAGETAVKIPGLGKLSGILDKAADPTNRAISKAQTALLQGALKKK